MFDDRKPFVGLHRLLGLLALLVSDGAGSLAGGLAGSLALTTATVSGAHLQSGASKSLNVLQDTLLLTSVFP